MRINTNLNAMTALNSATKNTALAGSSMEKLSSGLKINKAADNATGLAISEKMRSQIRGLDQASQNTQDGISVVQTAEGAIEEVGNIVQRMRELAVQGANDTNTSDDRVAIEEEMSQLTEEISRISETTEFNGQSLLKGTFPSRENPRRAPGQTPKFPHPQRTPPKRKALCRRRKFSSASTTFSRCPRNGAGPPCFPFAARSFPRIEKE